MTHRGERKVGWFGKLLRSLSRNPGKTDRCMSCDLNVHHPGRNKRGCNCGTCGSGTGRG